MRLEEARLTFDVWSLSCIGAWLGCVYHAAPKGSGIAVAEEFFRAVGRPDRLYSKFPVPTPFAPDFVGNYFRAIRYLMNPASYRDIVLPFEFYASVRRVFPRADRSEKLEPLDIHHDHAERRHRGESPSPIFDVPCLSVGCDGNCPHVLSTPSDQRHSLRHRVVETASLGFDA